jgi:hypothetical protein
MHTLAAQGHFERMRGEAHVFLSKYKRYAPDPAPGEREPEADTLTPSRLAVEVANAWPDQGVEAHIDFATMRVCITAPFNPQPGWIEDVTVTEIGG